MAQTSCINTKWPLVGAILAMILTWSLWWADWYPRFQHTSTSKGHPSVESWTSNSQKSINGPTTPHTSATILHPTQTKKPTDRPLILYAFFETPLSRKNLEFFLKHGLHEAADFLFILNGDTDAGHLIPSRPNIRYIRRRNDCFDMGAFAEVLVKDNFYKQYNRFITMNASIRGPFFPTWSTSCWSDVFLNKISDEVKLVGMTLGCRPLAHVQSMIWATDRIGLETLLFPSAILVEKFKAELPPHDSSNPVPPWESPGINFCPHEYWKAVAAEVYATPLLCSAGYKIDVMMTAYSSIPNYEVACREWMDGDMLSRGHYYGMDLHPFDTIFVKTNRGNDPITLETMTMWTDERRYSSYDYCH